MDVNGVFIIVSTVLSIAFAFVAYLRDGRRDMIEGMSVKLTQMEAAHAQCQEELASLRHELAWVRQNMVLRSP